jgi:hypothetical protein
LVISCQAKSVRGFEFHVPVSTTDSNLKLDTSNPS